MLVYSFLVDKKSSQYEEKNSAKTFYDDIQYSLLRHINCVLLDFNLSPIFFFFFLDMVYIDFALRCDTDKINSPSSDFYSYLEQNYQIDCFKNLGFFPSKFQINEANNGVDRRQENVPDRDVKDLFFAILDKNQDKELSVEEFYLLKSWREVSSTFGDIYHRFWSGKESSITQSGGYTSN